MAPARIKREVVAGHFAPGCCGQCDLGHEQSGIYSLEVMQEREKFMSGIINNIEAVVLPGAVIPKPQTDREHRVKSWGTRAHLQHPQLLRPVASVCERRDRIGVATGIRATDVGGGTPIFLIHIRHGRML